MMTESSTDPTPNGDVPTDDLDQTDTRQWTQQHRDAANIHGAPIMAMSPPADETIDTKDVDVRGPGEILLKLIINILILITLQSLKLEFVFVAGQLILRGQKMAPMEHLMMSLYLRCLFRHPADFSYETPMRYRELVFDAWWYKF
jgi:hypothetical protein